MVRSSRLVALMLAVLLASACGDESPSFGLAVESPDAAHPVVFFPLATVRGRANAVRALHVRIGAQDETYAFEAKPGITVAFRVHGATPPPPVTLEGLAVETPGPEAGMAALKERLARHVPEAQVREPVGKDAFLVDLPGARDDLVASVAAAALPSPDVRFLVQVLPREAYPAWQAGRTPTRLAAPPLPWSGTQAEFDAYKEAEVERWRAARARGAPYVPSRPDLFVLPHGGTSGEDVLDYAVLEWPRDEAQRFDGRMLENARIGRDPASGMPVVLYDVREAYRRAFQAWTKANVGLPLAIVVDWRWMSAPLINAPLADSVQITLGSGPVEELDAQAHRLAGVLGGSGSRVPVDLVAVALWHADGGLELLLPLEPRVDTKLVLEAQGAAAGEPVRVERTLRFLPGLDADGRSAVDARLAEILLGRLDAETAAPLLRADTAAAVERLAWWAKRPGSYRCLEATALLGLVDPRDPAAARALLDLLHHENAGVRVAAAQALHEPARTDDRAFEALLGAATSDDERLRREAWRSLTGLGPARREQLVARLDDEDPGLRATALGVLAAELDPTLVPHVVPCLDDADVRVRRLAAGWLRALAMNDVTALKAHAQALAARLADADREVRMTAAQTLAEMGEEVLPEVRPLARAEEPETRAAALYALARLARSSREVADLVARALDDPALPVRLAAAAGFLMPANPRARPAAVSPERVQRVLPVLEEALASTEVADRRVAATLLWLAGPAASAASDALRLRLDDAEEPVRVYAAAALQRMGKGDARSRAILDAVKVDPRHPLHGIEDWIEPASDEPAASDR